MFKTQYNEQALAVDEIAERIDALGFPAPRTYSEFTELSSIEHNPGHFSAEQMIQHLIEEQEAVVRTARSLFPLIEENKDAPTIDLLTRRMETHEKTAWMLRSLLEKK